MVAHHFRGDYNISRDPLLQKSLIAEGLTSCSLNIEKKDTRATVSEGPFTLQKFFGMARIKMVRIPKNIAWIPRLHIFFLPC